MRRPPESGSRTQLYSFYYMNNSVTEQMKFFLLFSRWNVNEKFSQIELYYMISTYYKTVTKFFKHFRFPKLLPLPYKQVRIFTRWIEKLDLIGSSLYIEWFENHLNFSTTKDFVKKLTFGQKRIVNDTVYTLLDKWLGKSIYQHTLFYTILPTNTVFYILFNFGHIYI